MKKKLFLMLLLTAALLLVLPLAAQAYSDMNLCPATGAAHDWFVADYIAPTCKERGSRTQACRNCGTATTEILDPLGHNWVEDRREPTCTQDGSIRVYCSRCGYTGSFKPLRSNGHQWGNWEVKEATCTEAGYATRSCLACGTTERDRETPALGHVWDNGQVTAQPTCTAEGRRTYTCIRCGATRSESIVKTNHSPTSMPAVAATCTTGGKTGGTKCAVCGTILSAQGESPALGHSWEGWVEYEPATCVSYGTRYHTCRRCGTREYDRNYAAGYGDHDWGEWVTVKAATAGEDGLEERTCRIDASHKEQRVIPALSGGQVTVAPSDPTVAPNEEERRPELTLTYLHDHPDKKDVYDPNDYLYTYYRLVNTGNMPLYVRIFYDYEGTTKVSWGEKRLLNPGEVSKYNSLTALPIKDFITPGTETDDLLGTVTISYYYVGLDPYADDDVELCRTQTITRTWKVGKPTDPNEEERRPELTLEYLYDYPDKDVFDPDDKSFTYSYLTNTGNVPLYVKGYYTFEGKEGTVGYYGLLNPGELCDWKGIRAIPVKDYITPGTETDDLLGTVTVSYYYVGLDPDPDSDEELCRTQTITRTWKVGKPTDGPTPWQIPEESAMTVEVMESSASADPAGCYMLGEKWGTNIVYTNTGAVVIPEFKVYDPFDGFQGEGRDFTPGRVDWLPWTRGIITEEDVERGYIYLPPVQVTWTDPDSGNEKIAYSNPLTLPVIGKTKLLLQKGIAHNPVNGAYFQEGEQIDWVLTVSNVSDEPIRNVVVTDEGAVVGTFAEIAPHATETCAVPPHTVTEYEARVAGSVSNTAFAVGTDLSGAEHSCASNVVTVPTNVFGPPLPLPLVPGETSKKDDGMNDGSHGSPAPGIPETPTSPGTPGGGPDPLGPIRGVNVDVTVYKATAHGPKNGEWYALGEQIDYTVTVRNNGDVAIQNVQFFDSLAGLASVDSIAALAPGEEHTFDFAWTVTQNDIDNYGYVVNHATITYTFNGVNGTPQQSNPVYVVAGEKGHIPSTIGGDVHDGGESDGGGGHPSFPGLTPGGITYPVTYPVGTPVVGPDGHPVTTPGGSYFLPDGTPVLIPAGTPVVMLPDGSHCIIIPYGPILTDETGTPILDGDGHLILLDWSGIDASCALVLTSQSDNEISYTLHACSEHLEAAKQAEASSPAEAIDIWFGEIDKLYDTLYQAGNDVAKAAVMNDRIMFRTYCGTYRALYGDEALRDLLRLRCAELCCMLHTVQDQMPDSMLGQYATLVSGMSYDAAERAFGPLNGRDCSVTVRLNDALADALTQMKDTVFGTSRYAANKALAKSLVYWQTALDKAVNQTYKASDRSQRAVIAAWRQMLDQVYAARTDLLTLLYPDNDAVAQECLMNLYRDAAIDACGQR